MTKYEYAYMNDEEEKIVDAIEESSETLYKCPECREPVLIHVNGFLRKILM